MFICCSNRKCFGSFYLFILLFNIVLVLPYIDLNRFILKTIFSLFIYLFFAHMVTGKSLESSCAKECELR